MSDWDAGQLVAAGVDDWLRWLSRWEISRVRTRSRVCKKCAGSPLVLAAGFAADVPHQVKHALVSRMHRIIDSRVTDLTAAQLPLLHAELEGAQMWRDPHRFDPRAGLDPAYDGIELDPEPAPDGEAFLFTLEQFDSGAVADVLPRPPLTPAEKLQLRREIVRSDEFAQSAGQAVSFELMQHRSRIAAGVKRFVEPQVAAVIAELSLQLEDPRAFG